jgi:hypothetical protein
MPTHLADNNKEALISSTEQRHNCTLVAKHPRQRETELRNDPMDYYSNSILS